MRSVKRKVVYGKFGIEADIKFLQDGILSSLYNEKCTKAEIKQLWKEIYQRRKRIEKMLKPSLKEGEEHRTLYEKKIEEIRKKMEEKNKNRVKI